MNNLLFIAAITFLLCMVVLHKTLYTWYRKETGKRTWNLARAYYWSGLIMLSGFVATGAVLAFK